MKHFDTVTLTPRQCITALTPMLSLWACYLGIAWFDSANEVEHAHIAWLVAVAKLRPLTGFFEHHLPVFWDVLGLYFRAGGTGPEVLYFGRALVLFFSLVFLAGLFAFARARCRSREDAVVASALGGATFLALAILSGSAIAIRPESLALPFLAWSVALWIRAPSRAGRDARDIAAGLLFGLALYATPRALLAGGLYLILAECRRRDLARRALAFTAGTLLPLATLPAILDHEYRYLGFALRFSSHVFGAGEADGAVTAGTLLASVATGGFFLAALLFVVLRVVLLPRDGLPLYRSHVSHIALVTAAVVALHWRGLYPHCFFPLFVVIPVALTDLFRLVDWTASPLAGRMVAGGMAGMVVAASAMVLGAAHNDETLARAVEVRRQIVSLLRPTDRIALSWFNHPIVFRNASFYPNGINGPQDRLCRLVASYEGTVRLPPCDFYLELLRTLPRFTDYERLDYVPRARRRNLELVVSVMYRQLPLQPEYGRPGGRTILALRAPAGRKR